MDNILQYTALHINHKHMHGLFLYSSIGLVYPSSISIPGLNLGLSCGVLLLEAHMAGMCVWKFCNLFSHIEWTVGKQAHLKR